MRRDPEGTDWSSFRGKSEGALSLCMLIVRALVLEPAAYCGPPLLGRNTQPLKMKQFHCIPVAPAKLSLRW